MGKALLITFDFVMSLMWVWASVLVKLFVFKYLGIGHDAKGEILKISLSIVYMFFFTYLGKITKGAAYNPLTVLVSAVSGDFSQILFTLGARIPAQVLGSIAGVKLIIITFPEIGRGPQLSVDLHQGALTEGLLTFMIISISLGLAVKIPGSFFMKTWISSLSKLTLNILGSDLTGGCMNPAAVMGWAYARGDHITKEHIVVYWAAPIQATILAVMTFHLVVKPLTEEKDKSKTKSE